MHLAIDLLHFRSRDDKQPSLPKSQRNNLLKAFHTQGVVKGFLITLDGLE